MSTEILPKSSDQKRNFVTHPTKTNVLVFIGLWTIGNGLLTLVVTDLFTEGFFHKKYFITYLMMLLSTLSTYKVISNYFKNNRKAQA